MIFPVFSPQKKCPKNVNTSMPTRTFAPQTVAERSGSSWETLEGTRLELLWWVLRDHQWEHPWEYLPGLVGGLEHL
jgi:hypothetical protein